MKPNELLLDPTQPLILTQGGGIKLEDIMDHQNLPTSGFVKTSPARDALSELLEMPHPTMATVNEESSGDLLNSDANSLIVDLNDLLKRDPTLSSLSEDNLAVDVNVADSNFDFMNSINPNNVSNAAPTLQNLTNVQGMEIPMVKTSIGSLLVPNNSPATWTTMTPAAPGVGQQMIPNATVIKTEDGGYFGRAGGAPPGGPTSFQPTLAELNSDGIKIESVDLDLDDIGNFFMKNSSPNVTLGVGPSNRPNLATSVVGVSAGVQKQPQQQVQQTFNPNWQGADDSNSFSGTSNPWSTLSSSMPTVPGNTSGGASGSGSYNISPLSDILTDLSSNSGSTPNQSLSPNLPSHSPSQAGPTRTSTLHKLLMRKDQAKATGRPSPVRSPDGVIIGRPGKTLEVIRNSLSSSSTLLTGQSQLSASAPVNHSYMSEAAAAASGSGYPRVWARREPRPHISSVCSVGETSTLADEVNEVLGRMDPNDLQDIVSDDEDDNDDDNSQIALNEAQTSDDDSELEGTSPSTSKLNTSGASSSGSKKERHFWQYNVQAKGPKGQKINFETRIDDPHKLNDIVDPVFSGDVQLQGIKHSGKARRGDGNDLTANPKKLAAIGKELDQLSKIINDLTPVSEMPFGARCKSRKEKNKLASRACRLKKKAQHEANKLKCEGLATEHNELIAALEKAKGLLMEKANPNSVRSQQEITEEFDLVVQKATCVQVAGNTSLYVNKMIEKHMPYV